MLQADGFFDNIHAAGCRVTANLQPFPGACDGRLYAAGLSGHVR
jgi:hypothetical protein